eukprot:SAG25_NODE_696_length_5890_cov_4.438612_5_plen_203_part_00
MPAMPLDAVHAPSTTQTAAEAASDAGAGSDLRRRHMQAGLDIGTSDEGDTGSRRRLRRDGRRVQPDQEVQGHAHSRRPTRLHEGKCYHRGGLRRNGVEIPLPRMQETMVRKSAEVDRYIEQRPGYLWGFDLGTFSKYPGKNGELYHAVFRDVKTGYSSGFSLNLKSDLGENLGVGWPRKCSARRQRCGGGAASHAAAGTITA